MKPKEWRVLEMAVSDGALRGVRRAYKHNEEPTEEQIAESVSTCVLGEISDWFDFEEMKE